MVRVSKDWSYRGKEAVVLENSRLRVTLLPSSGARIFELVDKATDTDLLWHHPRRGPEPAILGSPSADLWWAGGVDDIFPTDFPCVYRNEQLPYLGYGGWRNTYSVIPQIATGWPGDLAGAIKASRQRTLGANQSTSTEIHLGCLSGVATETECEEKMGDIDLF